MAEEAQGMDMSETLETSHRQNVNASEEERNLFSPNMELGDGVSIRDEEKTSDGGNLVTNHRAIMDLTSVKQLPDPMDLISDEENPVKDEIMEDLSENLAEPQHFPPTVSSATARKYAKLRRRYHLEKIVRLFKSRRFQDYGHQVMALKIQLLETEKKIKENLWKKSRVDLTMSKIDKQIKSYKLQKIELDLAKSKLEYAMIQLKNRTLQE